MKRKKVKRLGRGPGARRALLRSLARALVQNEAIVTSRERAKVLRGFIDKLVNIANKDTLASRRRLIAVFGNDKSTAFGLIDIARAFGKRRSGFTRIIPLGKRKGDNMFQVKVQWVEKEETKNDAADISAKS